MKKAISLFIMLCALLVSVAAQSDERHSNRNFPIVVTVNFHGLALPFQQVKVAFANIGFGLGTEVSYNSSNTWIQKVNLIWYRNKAAGNGITLNTQMAWRPGITSDLYSEVMGGVGYLYSFRPSKSFKLEQGRWTSAGKRGKGMLTIPVGISVGYDPETRNNNYSPFVGYQFMIIKGYNTSIPIVPATFMQFGTKFNTKN